MNEDYPDEEEEEVTEGDTPERAGEFDEGDPIEQEMVDTTFVGSQTNVISQCPVENGAIRTTWGAISGGPVITGIAGKYIYSVGENFFLLLISKFVSLFQPASINNIFQYKIYWPIPESEVDKVPDKVNCQQLTIDGQLH